MASALIDGELIRSMSGIHGWVSTGDVGPIPDCVAGMFPLVSSDHSFYVTREVAAVKGGLLLS
jgi:hypothetical protein